MKARVVLKMPKPLKLLFHSFVFRQFAWAGILKIDLYLQFLPWLLAGLLIGGLLLSPFLIMSFN